MSRVLVVDDDADVRNLLARWVAAEGHDVSVAGTGEEALALLDAGDFALALLDVRLPDISGFEVAMRLKGTATKVVMVSITDWRDRPDELADVAWLAKPFTRAAVRGALGALAA